MSWRPESCGIAASSTPSSPRWCPAAGRASTPELQDILRLGAYQLTGLDRVPDHAAVDTSVTLAKVSRRSQVGGVRERRLAAAGPLRAHIRTRTRRCRASGSRWSIPIRSGWCVAGWTGSVSSGRKRLLRWNNTRPRLVLQPARADPATLATRWRASGIEVEPAPYRRRSGQRNPEPAVRASRLSRRRLHRAGSGSGAPGPVRGPVAPDALVYDACAAPGGKTIASRSRGQDRRGRRGEPVARQAAGREPAPRGQRRGAGRGGRRDDIRRSGGRTLCWSTRPAWAPARLPAIRTPAGG